MKLHQTKCPNCASTEFTGNKCEYCGSRFNENINSVRKISERYCGSKTEYEQRFFTDIGISRAQSTPPFRFLQSITNLQNIEPEKNSWLSSLFGGLL